MSNKKELFLNRLVIAQNKIMGLVEEVANGLDVETEAGKLRVRDRFSTIAFNLNEAFDTAIPKSEQVEVVEEERKQTFDEFIDEVMEYFDYKGDLLNVYRPMLVESIETLKAKGGGYTLAGGLKNGAIAKFKLTVKNGTITIDIEGDENVFYFTEEEKHQDYSGSEYEEQDDDYEDYEAEYEEEESYQYEEEEEEEGCNCLACQYENMEEEDVYDAVDSILSYIESDVDELERVISEYFGNEKLGASVKELSEDDFALIRAYLIHVKEADKNEVLELTDRGLMAAWNYHLYIKNNQ
ncbi:hypothetical protein BCB4_0012 [Bacillus phage B4]|uniref:Uncharacterized protein n=2 Tax=Bequatrovirus B4 TaxID=1918005 RepID=J9Q9C3_9CAUD|nr:hypothetical protein BCB4_0012 [Bacillus phage B4]YP_009783608.1 hypothetical protein QLX26_gp012 [Bacillus phage B5S]AEW47246.1 hypothetical protein B5S_0012 [Bacillus phage B5S]AEZ65805.1 hypothetical protein BCB4_0012 [Bacillus phage B4]